MVVVSVCLALWIGIVWWQDKRTLARYGPQRSCEEKLEEVEMPQHIQHEKDLKV